MTPQGELTQWDAISLKEPISRCIISSESAYPHLSKSIQDALISHGLRTYSTMKGKREFFTSMVHGSAAFKFFTNDLFSLPQAMMTRPPKWMRKGEVFTVHWRKMETQQVDDASMEFFLHSYSAITTTSYMRTLMVEVLQEVGASINGFTVTHVKNVTQEHARTLLGLGPRNPLLS